MRAFLGSLDVPQGIARLSAELLTHDAEPVRWEPAGAVMFEGTGTGRCNCSFAKNYPYAFQPRLGGAYKIGEKTVLRLGFGIVYSGTADSNGGTSGGLAKESPDESFATPWLNVARTLTHG